MASSKKPSIYSDRGGIGSVNELDEYGVWVKSEPQVLSADSSDTVKSGDLDDSVGFASDDLSASDALSFDDAVLDAKGASVEDSSSFTDMEFPDDNIEIDSSGDSLSLDSDLDDLNITDTELSVPQDDSSHSDNFEIEDTNFDDFETPAESSESETESSADDDFEIKDDLDLDSFNDLTTPEQAESGKQDSAGADDFEVEDFTVPTVKAIESNVQGIQEDFNAVSKNKEGDLSTQLLLKIANELSSIRGELSELKKEFSNIRPASAAADDKHDKSGFFSEEDDETIALTGDELDNILVNTDEAAQETETSAESPPDDSPSAGEGFPLGDDDGDEAIALTGDELDNILNSADFTEESGTNETVESDFPLDDEPEASQDDTEEAKTDEDIELDADLADLGTDDDLGSDLAQEEEDVNPDTGLAALVSDDDLGSVLAPDDEDIDLGADLAASGADDDLGSDLAQEEDEGVNPDTGLAALVPDDDIGSGLAPDDEDIDLDADFAATDDSASQDSEIPGDDLSLEADEAATGDDISLEADEAAAGDDISLEADEASAGDDISLDADELIDIDTDDLNIDLDPDTLLNEQNETDPLSESTDDLTSDELDADLSGADPADDVFSDSEKHDSPELEHLRSEGATPITFAPENSLYLEEEEDLNSDSLDLSNAVIDEPALSADGINDDIEEPSLNDGEFDLDALDDLTIDNSLQPETQEEEPVSSQDALDGMDIDIPPEDDFFAQEQPAGEEDLSFDTGAFDTEETVIPEGFEAETEEKPIPFDDDLDEDIMVDDFGDALDIPGIADEEIPPAPAPAPRAAPAPQQAPAPRAAPAPQQAPAPAPAPKAPTAPAPQQAPAPKAAPAPQAAPQEAKGGAVPSPLAAGPQTRAPGKDGFQIPSVLKSELRNILSYMDQLLESLPEDKIEEFAKSEYFDSYKKLFKELGLV